MCFLSAKTWDFASNYWTDCEDNEPGTVSQVFQTAASISGSVSLWTKPLRFQFWYI